MNRTDLEKLYDIQRVLIKDMPDYGTKRDVLDMIDALIDEIEDVEGEE